jgi:hypothetical protein
VARGVAVVGEAARERAAGLAGEAEQRGRGDGGRA